MERHLPFEIRRKEKKYSPHILEHLFQPLGVGGVHKKLPLQIPNIMSKIVYASQQWIPYGKDSRS